MKSRFFIVSQGQWRYFYQLFAWVVMVVGCQPNTREASFEQPPTRSDLLHTRTRSANGIYGPTWIMSDGFAIDFERSTEEMFNFDIYDYLQTKAPHLMGYAEIISHFTALKKLSARLLIAMIEQQSGAITNVRFDSSAPLGELSKQTGFLEQVRDVCQRLRAKARPDEDNPPQRAISTLMPLDELNKLGEVYRKLFPGVISPRRLFGNHYTRQGPTLQFPYPTGQSWEFGGTHADDGSGSIYNSLDFSDGFPSFGTPVDVFVVASAPGKVYVGSSCYLEILHNDGWLTSYYHMDHITVNTGDMVEVNQPVGQYADNHSQAICDGGSSDAEHVHWGLWLDNQPIALDDIVLSGWTVHPGQSNYDDNCNRFYLHRDGNKTCAWTRLENEGASCTENNTRPTSCGVGACSSCAGEETCKNGAWVVTTACDPMCTATEETCNDIDDDCDGTADESLDTPTTCGVGACAVCTGVLPCEGGPDTCDPFCRASIELCNNAVDDDCDGATDESDCVIELENLVLPQNGGVLESFTSEYGEGWVASNLTNEVTNEDGWASIENPTSSQEFVYSFLDGKNAFLAEAVIYGGTAEGQYYSKDIEVWTSLNGTDYKLIARGMLANSDNDSITLYLKSTEAKKVKLTITSGYKTDYWELSEFEVKGAKHDTQDNTAPTAKEQSITTAINTAKDITLGASDADNDTLTYHIVANPKHGSLSGTAPHITYTPNTNYTGPDSFTFKTNDGLADSNIATVSVTVESAANHAPVAQTSKLTTTQGEAKAINLSASDADGDSLTYRITSDPAHGTLTGSAPTMSYTPNANYTGSDSFAFKANDGLADSNAATVSIEVRPDNGTDSIGELLGCRQSSGSQLLFGLPLLGFLGLNARRKRSKKVHTV